MEEKTRGTPNPLSPSIDATLLDANPSEVLHTVADGVGPKHNKPAAPAFKRITIDKATHDGPEPSMAGSDFGQGPEIGTSNQPEINIDGWLNAGPDEKSGLGRDEQIEIDDGDQSEATVAEQPEIDTNELPAADLPKQPETDTAIAGTDSSQDKNSELAENEDALNVGQNGDIEVGASEQDEPIPIEVTGLNSSDAGEAIEKSDLAGNDASETETNTGNDNRQDSDQISESFNSDGATESDLAFDEATPEAEALKKANLAKAAAKTATAIPVMASSSSAIPPTPRPTMMQDVVPPTGNRIVDPMIATKPTRAPRPAQPRPEYIGDAVQSTVSTSYTQPMGVVTNIDGTAPSNGQTDPVSRPMKQMVLTETPKPKKKHTGLIIGIIVSLFLAIGCGVAALLLFLHPTSSDPVAKAVLKLANDGIPENVKINGLIDASVSTPTLPTTSIRVDLDSEFMPKSLINSSAAKLGIKIGGGSEMSMELDEVYAANGELFVKIDGVKDLVSKLSTQVDDSTDNLTLDDGTGAVWKEAEIVEGTNCAGGPDGTNCVVEVSPTEEEVATGGEEELMTLDEMMLNTIGELSAIDGEWIRFSSSEMREIAAEFSDESNPATCTAKLLVDAASDNNTLSQAYIDNPFIFSSSENVPVKSKTHDVYAMLVDEQNLKEFLSQTSDSQTMRNFASCMGYGNLTSGGTDKLIANIKELPQIYLEIDDEYNISRVYFAKKDEIPNECNCYDDMVNCNDACLTSGDYEVVVDLNLSYPATVNISAPTKFTDFSELINQLEQKIQTNVGPTENNE